MKIYNERTKLTHCSFINKEQFECTEFIFRNVKMQVFKLLLPISAKECSNKCRFFKSRNSDTKFEICYSYFLRNMYLIIIQDN